MSQSHVNVNAALSSKPKTEADSCRRPVRQTPKRVLTDSPPSTLLLILPLCPDQVSPPTSGGGAGSRPIGSAGKQRCEVGDAVCAWVVPIARLLI